MRVELARTAGFCYGVRRAVQMAEEAAGQGRPCVMLGPIIHNRDEISRLEAMGVGLAASMEEIPEGSAVLIRSHGEGRAVHEALAARGCTVIDATCPNVSRIHGIVSQAEGEGRQVLIIGTPTHPEVAAIAGWCAHPVVLEGRRPVNCWMRPRAAGNAPHHGVPNYLHPIYLGFLRRKSKKRVYKLKNF